MVKQARACLIHTYYTRRLSRKSTHPCVTHIGRRCKRPLDSGFKWVALSLSFHQLLGRDPVVVRRLHWKIGGATCSFPNGTCRHLFA